MNNKSNNKANNKANRKSDTIKLAIAAISIVAMLVIAFTLNNKDKSTEATGKGADEGTTGSVAAAKDSDLIIPISNITETATFYPAEVDGIKLEVLAVKAPDGTMRTAFNTCQVCYSSGRGYYVQEGDVLICQNCGNRFGMGDVEVTKGGCNPVPITDENKTADTDNITISKDYLTQATVIFSNWKN